MHGFLRKSTIVTVHVGPFEAPADGVSPQVALSAPASAGANATAGVALVKNGTAAGYTLSGWTADRLGYYTLTLSAGDTDTTGRLKLCFADAAHFGPVEQTYFVLEQAVYDWLFGTTAPLTTLGAAAPSNWVNDAAIAVGAITSDAFATGATIPRVTLVDTVTSTGTVAGDVAGKLLGGGTTAISGVGANTNVTQVNGSAATVATSVTAKLTADGLDAVPVESGVNARQALSGVFAEATGQVTGQDTNSPVIKAGNNPGVTRIQAVTDANGNRTSVTLSLPT